ncbi:2134_t:CDS:2 [Cetraspora pellucida]|uniref:2134_t:CDS:1 n=1 Tax=Cetraspora pellucida TaxID=1433469 RepID=A0ACA9LAX5_9GLOM|nr:2134_t:CDS:2 [Cetraspora pellucida]
MPICADTIVKIKFVKQNEKDKILNIWAIGTYPVNQDNEIELVLFLPKILDEKDPDTQNTQVIFEKDEYFAVGGKFNTENAIIETIVSDYAGHNYNFNVKVVFPFMNSRFAQLKNIIQPKESLIFIVGQMEIINNNLYINTKDISCINTNSNKKDFNFYNQQVSVSVKSCSKLLSIHQSIAETSGESSQKTLKLSIPNESVDEILSDSSLADPRPLKRTRNNNNKANKCTEELSDINNTDIELDTKKFNNKPDFVRKHEDLGSKNANTRGKKSTRGRRKGKEHVVQTTVHNTQKSCKNTININESQ